jgi:hypothetical protein
LKEVARARHALQTSHAIKASDLAESFNDAMRKMAIAPGDYVPELTTPEGPSTAGGKQAMQHLRLAPRHAGFPILVAGRANHAKGNAELRSYEYLAAIHRQRYRRPLALDRTGYEQFLAVAKSFFEALRLETSIAGPPADLAGEGEGVAEATASAHTSRLLLWSGLVAIALLALAAGWWMMLGRH